MRKYDIPEYEVEKFIIGDILTKSSSLDENEEKNIIEGGDLLPF